MWDHIFFGPSYAVNTVTHNWLADPTFAATAASDYRSDRKGILTNVGGDLLGKFSDQLFQYLHNETTLRYFEAFEKLPDGSLSSQTRQDLDNTFGSDWPDIEIYTLDAYTGSLDDFLLGAPDVNNYTSVCVALVSPFSRGNVTIGSSDTNDHPVVNPNWLSDARDQEVAIAGFKRARAVFEADAVHPVLKGPEAFPGANTTTDDEILEVIKTSSSTIHHAAGTCKMGKSSDAMAVVDNKGKLMHPSNKT